MSEKLGQAVDIISIPPRSLRKTFTEDIRYISIVKQERLEKIACTPKWKLVDNSPSAVLQNSQLFHLFLPDH